MKYYQDFFDTIFDIRHIEEPYYTQEMYGLLDTAIQAVLSDPDTTNAKSQLITAILHLIIYTCLNYIAKMFLMGMN